MTRRRTHITPNYAIELRRSKKTVGEKVPEKEEAILAWQVAKRDELLAAHDECRAKIDHLLCLAENFPYENIDEFLRKCEALLARPVESWGPEEKASANMDGFLCRECARLIPSNAETCEYCGELDPHSVYTRKLGFIVGQGADEEFAAEERRLAAWRAFIELGRIVEREAGHPCLDGHYKCGAFGQPEGCGAIIRVGLNCHYCFLDREEKQKEQAKREMGGWEIIDGKETWTGPYCTKCCKLYKGKTCPLCDTGEFTNVINTADEVVGKRVPEKKRKFDHGEMYSRYAGCAASKRAIQRLASDCGCLFAYEEMRATVQFLCPAEMPEWERDEVMEIARSLLPMHLAFELVER